MRARYTVGCDACAEHVPDHCVPWNLEAGGDRWRFCSLDCLEAWVLEQGSPVADEAARARGGADSTPAPAAI